MIKYGVWRLKHPERLINTWCPHTIYCKMESADLLGYFETPDINEAYEYYASAYRNYPGAAYEVREKS